MSYDVDLHIPNYIQKYSIVTSSSYIVFAIGKVQQDVFLLKINNELMAFSLCEIF